jgi:hypothetical protein
MWISDIVGAPSALAHWQYVQLWSRLGGAQLSTEPDMMIWRRTIDAQYSSRSCYDTLFQGGDYFWFVGPELEVLGSV